MEFIFLLAAIFLFGFITIVFFGVGATILSYLFMFFCLSVVGGIIFLFTGPWGLFIFIVIGILGSLSNRKKGRRRSSRKKNLKKWKEIDDELDEWDWAENYKDPYGKY